MAEREVFWTAPAEDDLLRIVEFIADDNPAAAERVLEHLLGRAASLSELTERGRWVPELGGGRVRRQRELVIRPWRLIYEVREDTVYVTGLFDSRRDVARLLHDRFSRGGSRV